MECMLLDGWCAHVRRAYFRVAEDEWLVASDGADEIGEEAVGGGDYAGLVLDDGEAENVRIETQRGGGSFEERERIGHRQLFRPNTCTHPGADAGCGAFGAADQLVAHTGGTGGAHLLGRNAADADALDFFELDGH